MNIQDVVAALNVLDEYLSNLQVTNSELVLDGYRVPAQHVDHITIESVHASNGCVAVAVKFGYDDEFFGHVHSICRYTIRISDMSVKGM